MNTVSQVKSFWLGWGSVSLAGIGAYYFAKQQINADRQSKLEAQRKKRQAIQSMEYAELPPTTTASGPIGAGDPARTDHVGSPSHEASVDPAATRHAPTTEEERIAEKSKYESRIAYRSKKGDRFS